MMFSSWATGLLNGQIQQKGGKVEVKTYGIVLSINEIVLMSLTGAVMGWTLRFLNGIYNRISSKLQIHQFMSGYVADEPSHDVRNIVL